MPTEVMHYGETKYRDKPISEMTEIELDSYRVKLLSIIMRLVNECHAETIIILQRDGYRARFDNLRPLQNKIDALINEFEDTKKPVA